MKCSEGKFKNVKREGEEYRNFKRRMNGMFPNDLNEKKEEEIVKGLKLVR